MAPGLTYRRLDWWTRQGFVKVAETGRTGSGYPRRYDDLEARVAVAAHRLSAVGFRMAVAAVLARYVVESKMRQIVLGHGLVLWVGSVPEEEVGQEVDKPLSVVQDGSQVETGPDN